MGPWHPPYLAALRRKSEHVARPRRSRGRDDEPPRNGAGRRDDEHGEVVTRAALASDQTTKRLAENVWLVDLGQSLPALGHLIALADARGISAGILPLEHEPQWLPADFDPTPIPGRSAKP